MRERKTRAIAGIFIIVSLLLGIWFNPNWFWVTGSVGALLLQSSRTNWCLMDDILKKLNVSK